MRVVGIFDPAAAGLTGMGLDKEKEKVTRIEESIWILNTIRQNYV